MIKKTTNDMKNKINIAELLKDCPKGMELYSPIFGELKFNEVNTINNRILVVQQNGYIAEFESDGRLINCKNGECLLFPSKGKTTWEGFVPPCKFKDGDVLVHTQNERFIMSIYKSNEIGIIINTHVIFWDREEGLSVGMQICCYTDSTRLATEEEKEKLFQAIKDNGYNWNVETKTLEKLVEPKFNVGNVIQDKDGYKVRITDVSIEDECYGYESLTVNGIGVISFNRQDGWELVPNKFDITTLNPFESRVLVRHNKDNKWCGSFFSHIDGDFHSHCYKYVTIAGKSYPMCIPYEKNEHLLGTTNDCDEFYKNW